MAREETRKAHPSYGVVTVHRATGNFDNLFQSDVGGNSGIVLEIKRAEVFDSGLGDDHVQPREELIEVHLSPLQWAEVITSMNLGAGTPCTIHWFDGDHVEEPPREEALAHRNARQFKEELDDLARFASAAGRRVEDILAKGGKMKAGDRDALAEIFRKLTKTITDSGPFMMKQTEQAVNRMVADAKATLTDHAHQLQLDPGTVTVPALGEGPVDVGVGPVGVEPEVARDLPPEIPDLPPREKELKPPEEYTARELAESIGVRLRRIEAEDRAARREAYGSETERITDADTKPGHFYSAGAVALHGGGVQVVYVSYQGGTRLTREDAVRYLRYLRDGGRGSHFEAFREGK